MDWQSLGSWVESHCGITLDIGSRQSVGGGCINEAILVADASGTSWFIKLNSASNLDLFEAEIKGLQLLNETGAIRVPEPKACGLVGENAVLVMEGLALYSWQDAQHQSKLGSQLAELHKNHSPNGEYGAEFDNHIGRTPQLNSPNSDWTEFYLSKRLDYQFQLAAKNGWVVENRSQLFDSLRDRLAGYSPKPSLLHGDLWSGNVAFDQQGNPVIFDPACYYGDGEADLAFTKMFGGFSPAFYRSYRQMHAAPSDEAWLHRLYNFYHELNHFNLFGGGYRQQAEATFAFLSEC